MSMIIENEHDDMYNVSDVEDSLTIIKLELEESVRNLQIAFKEQDAAGFDDICKRILKII